MSYDYLIIGAGLFGSVFAYEANKRGKKCLVLDKRNHIGGNIYCEKMEGINVHKYGAHIFHTNNKNIWEYMNQFCEFNNYINSPLAIYQNKIFNLPFNMNTFYQMWGVQTPAQAKKIIQSQQAKYQFEDPKNLEEQALMLVGEDIYYALIKGYTEKQWGKEARELPPSIIKRLPVRFTFNNNYFNDRYQGIPVNGYNEILGKLLKGIDVKVNVNFFDDKVAWAACAKKIVYTGMIDQYFDYQFGVLEYRSLRFEHEVLPVDNFQGNAVVNYTEREVPFTRIIEHKHFEFGEQQHTVITREFPDKWTLQKEPYYPVNDEKNDAVFQKYKVLAATERNVIFGGRLADYKYYDMHHVVASALNKVAQEFGEK